MKQFFPLPSGGFAQAFAAAIFLIFAGISVQAAEDGPATFRGVKVKPHKGTYLVLKNVNVRAKPKTKSKKVGSYKTGQRIKVVARAGGWVAVRKDGKDQGFVYDKVLMPLIDGALFKGLVGRVSAKGGADCEYVIHFEGKSPVEGQQFEISDYDVFWDCLLGKRKVNFRTPMFITEAPFQMGQKRIYQISIDILDLESGYDEIFSTIFLYDQDKARITFDGVSIKKFGKAPETKEAPANTVPEALTGAVRIALTVWNKAAWSDLIKNTP